MPGAVLEDDPLAGSAGQKPLEDRCKTDARDLGFQNNGGFKNYLTVRRPCGPAPFCALRKGARFAPRDPGKKNGALRDAVRAWRIAFAAGRRFGCFELCGSCFLRAAGALRVGALWQALRLEPVWRNGAARNFALCAKGGSVVLCGFCGVLPHVPPLFGRAGARKAAAAAVGAAAL